jgi:DNA-binding transcriptional regulator YdaS (Cro superfamily)
MRTIVHVPSLRAALALAGLRQYHLAVLIGVSPSSLSAFIVGRVEAPPDLRARIERVLRLPDGALAPSAAVERAT